MKVNFGGSRGKEGVSWGQIVGEGVGGCAKGVGNDGKTWECVWEGL